MESEYSSARLYASGDHMCDWTGIGCVIASIQENEYLVHDISRSCSVAGTLCRAKRSGRSIRCLKVSDVERSVMRNDDGK